MAHQASPYRYYHKFKFELALEVDSIAYDCPEKRSEDKMNG